MANDAEILKAVKKEVLELRKLGAEWGLTATEIHSCINSAFNTKLEIPITEKIAKKIKSQTRWRKIRFALRVWLAFLVSLCGFTLMVTQTDYLSTKAVKILQPYGYNILRVVRLAALPLHEKYNISLYHNEECLVVNPYFTPHQEDCALCEGIDSVRVTRLKKEKQISMENFDRPLLIRELNQYHVELNDIVSLIRKEKTLQDPVLKVKSNVEWVKRLSDLVKDDLMDRIIKEPTFNVEWSSRRIVTSQLLKRLFPRPKVLPSKLEVVIDKTVFISGPKAAHLKLPEGVKSRYAYYIQGSGSRVLEFYPRSDCDDTCDAFLVNVEPGDAVFYFNGWDVMLAPNNGEITIGFQGEMQ